MMHPVSVPVTSSPSSLSSPIDFVSTGDMYDTQSVGNFITILVFPLSPCLCFYNSYIYPGLVFHLPLYTNALTWHFQFTNESYFYFKTRKVTTAKEKMDYICH
jgi:hypothetical protein